PASTCARWSLPPACAAAACARSTRSSPGAAPARMTSAPCGPRSGAAKPRSTGADVIRLPPSIQVFERGWLSSNNILFTGADGTALVDSGYVTHAPQTLALVRQVLAGRPLERLLNTHLHSDHCGGNA